MIWGGHLGTPAKRPRHHRPITVDVHDDATDVPRRDEGQACVALGLTCILALGCQLRHQATCRGGGCWTRHSYDARVRLGEVPMWRRQCPPCRAVFTGLPPFVWRDRQRRPEGARAAWLAIHGGLRVARGAVSGHRSPMALDRLVWACGPHRLVAVVPRWEQARPVYGRADEPHRRGLPAKVSLPPLVSGRVLGHLGDPEHARTAACPHSSQGFHRAAVQQPPTARVRGLLTDGVDRTTSRLRTLCPGARLGHCRRHALTTRPGTLAAIASPVRQA